MLKNTGMKYLGKYYSRYYLNDRWIQEVVHSLLIFFLSFAVICLGNMRRAEHQIQT